MMLSAFKYANPCSKHSILNAYQETRIIQGIEAVCLTERGNICDCFLVNMKKKINQSRMTFAPISAAYTYIHTHIYIYMYIKDMFAIFFLWGFKLKSTY